METKTSTRKTKCATIVPVECAQSEWTIPGFDMLSRLNAQSINHSFRSARVPDVVWGLMVEIDSIPENNNISRGMRRAPTPPPPQISFTLTLVSGAEKLQKKVSRKHWSTVNVVFKVNSGENVLVDVEYANEFVTCCENVDKEFVQSLLVDGALTVTCSVYFQLLDGVPVEKFEPALEEYCQHKKPFSLVELLHNGLLSDCVIKVEEEIINCHKCLLAFHSPVFKSMFENSSTKEFKTGVVTITDNSVSAVRDMLEYMYSGQVKNLNQNAEELLIIANKYNISDLMKTCEEALVKNLSVDNICRLLAISDLHSTDDMKKACLNFVNENRKTILKTDEWEKLKSSFPKLANSALEWIVEHSDD